MRATQDNALSCLIIGISLGLLAGFLWAPRVRKEMRDQLRRGADDGLECLNRESEHICARTRSWYAKIKAFFGDNMTKPRGDTVERSSLPE